MKKLNSSGSAVLYIVIALVVVVVIVVFGVITVFLLTRDNEVTTDNDAATNETSNLDNGDSNSQGTTTGDDTSNPDNGDSNSQGTTTVDDTSNSDNGGSNSQGATSEGDYAISNVSELLPVCADNSFPSGIVSTSSGKKTAIFLQPKVGDDYEYSSTTTSTWGLSPGYVTNEVDLVACLEATGTESFQVPCTIKDTSFKLVGYEFDVTVYDLHSKRKVGSSKVNHSKQCPIFAVLSDGKDDASRIDSASLADYINSL